MSTTKVCIVQLTRIGDIIQTFQAARQFKYENPSFSLSLIARRDMAKGLIFLLKDVFDDIFLFETSDFLPVGTKTLTSARDGLNSFINEVNQSEFDLLLNFSFTSSSSYLCNLLSSKVKMGIRRNSTNQLVVTDKWSQYVYSNILDSDYCPYNLVDIYRNMLGAKDNHSFAFDQQLTNTISIHPFASTDKKRFSNDNWSKLIFRLLKANPSFELSILGAKEDLLNAQEILNSENLKDLKHRVHSKVGTLTIEESFNVVNNSKLFIGHDSMVSHLASIAEKESIIISLGSVKPFETSPYNDKVINIAVNDKGTDVNTETVFNVCNKVLKNETIDKEFAQKSLNIFTTKNLSIFKSSFDQSGLRLENLLETTSESSVAFKKFLRVCFSYYLKGEEVEMSIPKLNQEAIHTFKILKDGLEYMNELFHHAMITCNSILDETNKKNPDSNKIKSFVAKLSEIDKLLLVTINKYKLLKPIHDFFYINRLNSQGEDLIQITQSNLISYYDAQNFITYIEDLTNTTLGPKIISRNTIQDV
jgi:ADP-heptose:LPS heptosyltransferase